MADPIYSEVTPATAPSAPSPATGTRRERAAPDSSGSSDSGARLAPKARHRRARWSSGASPSLAPPRHKLGGPAVPPHSRRGTARQQGRAAPAAAARYLHLPLPSRPGLLSPFSPRCPDRKQPRSSASPHKRLFGNKHPPPQPPAPFPWAHPRCRTACRCLRPSRRLHARRRRRRCPPRTMATAGRGRGRGAAPPGSPQLLAGSSCNPRGPAAVRGGSSVSSSSSQPGCLPACLPPSSGKPPPATCCCRAGTQGGRPPGSPAAGFC